MKIACKKQICNVFLILLVIIMTFQLSYGWFFPKTKLSKEKIDLVFNKIATFSYVPFYNAPRVFYIYDPMDNYGSELLKNLFYAAQKCKFAFYVFIDDAEGDESNPEKLLSVRALSNKVSLKNLVYDRVPATASSNWYSVYREVVNKSHLFNEKILEPLGLDEQFSELILILETGELFDREVIGITPAGYLIDYLCSWASQRRNKK